MVAKLQTSWESEVVSPSRRDREYRNSKSTSLDGRIHSNTSMRMCLTLCSARVHKGR